MNAQKKAFFDKMLHIIEERIESYQAARASVYESRNTATKSTAGDKHETSRALMQTELENIEKQLARTLELKQRLLQMPKKTSKGSFGSLIKTDSDFFYLSIGLGQIAVPGAVFLAISPASPLGNIFLGSKAGDVVRFRDDVYKITAVL